jgi:aminoglycoside phosphotransferase (APT) family kinase protein
VFRFPKRAERVSWLLAEAELTRRIADRLPVPIPRHELIGEPGGVPGDGFTYPFVGHRLIPGLPFKDICGMRQHWPTIARRFGALLSAVHAIDPAEIADIDLQNEARTHQQLLEQAAGRADQIREHIPAMAPHLRFDAEPPPAYTGPPRLHHADIGDDHVLFDPAAGALTGLIDWADARVGDPVGDFVGLYVLFGEGFIREVLAHYTLPVEDTLIDRLRFDCRYLPLLWIAHQLDGAAERPYWADWYLNVYFMRPENR